MSQLEIGLIVAASMAAYLFGAGAMYPVLDAKFESTGGAPDPVVAGTVFWPVALFLILGAAFARKVTGRD